MPVYDCVLSGPFAWHCAFPAGIFTANVCLLNFANVFPMSTLYLRLILFSAGFKQRPVFALYRLGKKLQKKHEILQYNRLIVSAFKAFEHNAIVFEVKKYYNNCSYLRN